jgi:transcriptional regulator with XRE-family HTH domain
MEQNLVIPDVFIGSKIQAVFESRNMKLSDFANDLGTVRQNVYRIFKKKDLDTGLLTKVSEVLNHNFFHYYTAGETSTNPNQETAGLRQQLDLARQEIDYLKRIIHLMDEKARLMQVMEESRNGSGANEQENGQKENRVANKTVSFF